MSKIDKESAEHYTWGQSCDGWHLVKTSTLSVIQEMMPPNTEEGLHFHNKAQQFFFILSGVATFELEEEIIELKPNQGIHIKPNQKHKIKNESKINLHFLVISEPRAHGDRRNI